MESKTKIEAEKQVRRCGRRERSFFANHAGGVVLVLLALSLPICAQDYRGTINGTVTDQSGAVIVGAQVQIVDENTKFASQATSNGTGLYSVPFLTPSTYDVRVSATGFSPAEQTGVVLVAADIKQVDIRLTPAATTATVTVTANQQMLDTETATIGSVLTANELHNAPNIDGNIYMMATRVAGTYSNFTQNTESTQWIPVGGGVSGSTIGYGIAGQQLVTMNGIDILPPEGNPSQYTGYLPPTIGVQELSIQTSTYDAQIGHTLGGVENTVLKTGTEALHGEGSFLFGDTIFNSNIEQRTALGQPRNDLNWSQPSFVVTGPVRIPKIFHGDRKTFFMVSYQHIQYTTSSATSFVGNVPTVKEQSGDFSELSTAANPTNNPANVEGLVFDPTTTYFAGTPQPAWCNPNCVAGERESFRQEYNEVANPQNGSTNYIPSSRFNPVGVNLLKYWPQPTAGIASTTQPGVGNFAPASGLSNANWMWMATFSVDHEFNERNKLTVAYLPYVWNYRGANEEFPYVNNITGGPGVAQYRKEYGGLIDYTATLSPTWVMDVRSGGFYHPFVSMRPGDNISLSKLGFTGASASFPHPNFPAISASGPFASYTSLTSGASIYEYSAIADNNIVLSKSFQRHTVKTGFQYLMERDDDQNPVSSFAGTAITFNTQFTNNNATNSTAAANGGDGIAALLLGYPASGTASIVPSPAYEWNYWAGFVQDDWRVTSKLTLNLGFRWDYLSPLTERHNQLEAGFDFSDAQPFNLPNATGTGIASSSAPPASTAVPQGYHGGLYFVNSPAWPGRQYYMRELGDRWQPRLGASYHIFPNTVLRGGFGIYFAPNYPGIQNNGFSSSTTVVGSTNGNYTPPTCSSAQGADAYGYCNISNPYPNGFVQPTRTLLGLSTGLGANLAFVGPNWVPYKNDAWSVGIEQQLPLQMLADIEYHGASMNGIGVGKNWNALPNCYYYGGGCPNAGNATALGASVTNPMAGYLPATSALNAAKIPVDDLYLPYPEFGTVTQGNATIVDGTHQRIGGRLYNGLYLTLTKRASHGLEARVAATYVHFEDSSTLLNAGDPVTQTIKFDDTLPNRYLVGDLVYDTPKFNVNHAMGYIMNGWKWSHSLNWQAGTSFAVPGSAFSTGVSPVTHHQSLTHWFNSCYIPVVANGNVGQTLNGSVNTSPVYGSPTNCQFGEQPAWIQQPTMTLNQLNGNPMRNVRLQEIPYYDMALMKEIHLHENVSFSIRAEAHNVLNNVLAGQGAGTSLTASTFGANSPAATVNGNPVYTQVNDPRIIRFEARLSF